MHHPIFQRNATWPISDAIAPVQVGSKHCHVASRTLASMQTNQVSNNPLSPSLPPCLPPFLPRARAPGKFFTEEEILTIKSINLSLETIQVASNLCKLSVLPSFFLLPHLLILIPSQRKKNDTYTHTKQ